ncbi:hypothetical protein ACUNV4_15365 [Granulosicoccus sp. 3-233]|uniref:hypothetical protein n=1 Tax=Granulosicoccus sp. 3-233 TaxID=3417969 RepID=UPI003D3338BF
MGKTYKTLPDEYFIDDFASYDLDEVELDDEMDSLLLDTSARRRKGKRSKRDHSARHYSHGSQQLPSDWYDSENFSGGNRHHWR